MTEAMPFLQKYDITFLRPLPIPASCCFLGVFRFIILKENFATIPVIRNSYEVL